MAVFITGGHGHIGAWAAYFLAKEGQQYAHSFGFEFRISRAREELGFEPRYSIKEGIQKYADWMKKVTK